MNIKINKKTIIITSSILIILSIGVFIYLKFDSVPPRSAYPYESCDLDHDMDCDNNDIIIFNQYFGTCQGDSNFSPIADFDASGCVTTRDKDELILLSK